jgi:hypothetical protein
MRECNDEHRECLTNSAHINAPTTLTVIDVNKMCVSNWKQSEPYLALSYVWGRTVNFELRLENLGKMFQANSLKNRWEQIPQTIKDSILLTAELGFRYLWVDALCIVQDDEDNKLKDIEQMASIYGCASITIVAADGSDASHGLRGTGESSRRAAPQDVLGLTPHHRVLVDVTFASTSRKDYFARGWTFQEYELSRRLIIFANDKVMWKCQRNELWEGHLSPQEIPFLPENSLTKVMEWPDLLSYVKLVRTYNSRVTRHDNDVLAAFSGVLGAINRQFPAGFVQGLPEFYFDVALLWQPQEPLRRRGPDDAHHAFPSWSWTGWHGRLNVLCCVRGIEEPRSDIESARPSDFGIETYPITQWYKTAGIGSDSVRICNDYETYRQLRVSERQENQNAEASKHLASLPQSIIESGWTLSTCIYGNELGTDTSKPGSTTIMERPCYRHPSVSNAFLYPLPIGQGPDNLQDSKFSYLRFQSRRVHLIATNKELPASRYAPCVYVGLATTTGTLVGVVRLNITSGLQRPDEACELVAISRGKSRLVDPRSDIIEERDNLEHLLAIVAWRTSLPQTENKLDKFYLQKKIGIYEYYNVMWIEWKNGIAYRKAVGRVYKEAWESLELEEVDVLLG